MSRTNYIFVDFENIHQVDLELIKGKAVVVILVVGERNKNLPIDLVEKLLRHPAELRLVRTRHAGRDALDFVLAYHIGRQAVADPHGYFHILSKDTGFDSLVGYLNDSGILAGRHEALGKIPVLKIEAPLVDERSPQASPLDERVNQLKAHFTGHQSNRPKKEKTLRTHIHAHFGKKLTDAELEATVKALTNRNVIQITATGAVSYLI